MAQNRYDSKREVYVTPFTGSTVRYGFLTNVEAAVGTVCGHTAVDRANLPVGLVFGANAPKPGRASRRTAGGFDSTFYDIGSVVALRAAGWSLTRPFIRRARPSARSNSVFVTIQGVKYAWKMPSLTYANVGGDRAVLGIDDATQADRDLVWGASYPKPPKATKSVAGAGGQDQITTFVDPASVDNLPQGWAIGGKEFILG